MGRMAAGHLAHLAQQILEYRGLSALRPVQRHRRHERHGRRQGAGGLAVLLVQLRTVRTVEALLHLLGVDVMLSRAPLHRLLRVLIVAYHADDAVQQHLRFVHRFDDARMIDVAVAFVFAVLALEPQRAVRIGDRL